MNKHKIHIIIVVWGADFTRPLLTVTLPTLLAPGNIPALAYKADLRLQIFTSSENHLQITNAPALQKIRQYADVNIVPFGDLDEIKKHSTYHLHTSILQVAIGCAREEKADLLFLAPDFVISDGSLLKLYEMLDGRNGAVLFPSIRVKKYSFLPDLLANFSWEISHAKSLTVSGRELSAIALQHLHPLVHSATVARDDEGKVYCRPPLFYWNIGSSGLLVHSLIMSPIYLRPRIWPEVLEPTIDFQDFPAACGISTSELLGATDSDDALILEFSSFAADFFQTDRSNATIDCVMDWIARLGMPHHINNLRFSYTMHSGEIADLSVREAMINAKKMIHDILERTNKLIEFDLAPRLRDTSHSPEGDSKSRLKEVGRR